MTPKTVDEIIQKAMNGAAGPRTDKVVRLEAKAALKELVLGCMPGEMEHPKHCEFGICDTIHGHNGCRQDAIKKIEELFQ